MPKFKGRLAQDAEEERKPISVTETHVRQHPNGARATRTTQQSFEPESKMIDPYGSLEGGAEKRTGREASNQANQAKTAKDAATPRVKQPKPILGSSQPKSTGKIRTAYGMAGSKSAPSPYKRTGKDEVADTPDYAVEHIKGVDFKRTGRDIAAKDAASLVGKSPGQLGIEAAKRDDVNRAQSKPILGSSQPKAGKIRTAYGYAGKGSQPSPYGRKGDSAKDTLVNSNGRLQNDAQPAMTTTANAAIPVVRRANDGSATVSDAWNGRTV